MTTSIHLKIEYPEAVSMKRETLLIQESLLKIIKHIKIYSELRQREFLHKARLKKEIIALRNLVSSIEKEFPEEDLSILTKSTALKTIQNQQQSQVQNQQEQLKNKKSEILRAIKEKRKKSNPIERELDEIRNKLAALNG